jgi:hypothetical protein
MRRARRWRAMTFSMQQATRDGPVPPAAVALGVAGLLPLLLGVPLALNKPDIFGINFGTLVETYAALILSFIGGIHWGFVSVALARDPDDPSGPLLLTASVLPALAGWIALFLPGRLGPLLLLLAFASLLVMDRRVVQRGLAPRWWLWLRTRLTIAIVFLLLLLSAGPATD